jgi:hypothetical protein
MPDFNSLPDYTCLVYDKDNQGSFLNNGPYKLIFCQNSFTYIGNE